MWMPHRIAGETVLTASLRSVKRRGVHFQNPAKLSGL
jgi:hypothetical protein